jgi:tripartite-type tricarboxylate transporter receptor subunit TctC
MKIIHRIAQTLALSALLPLSAQAAWPEQPIRLVVPYAAGGGADNVARAMAGKLGERLGQTIVVENKPGAGGTIAEGLVARATPDGYTVLYDTFTYAVNGLLRKLSFDPARDLSPVAMVATAPMIFVVNPAVKAKDIGEFLALAKQPGSKVTYASFGVGSSAHLATEMLARDAGVTMLHIPYKGGAPALVDVVGGQVDAYFANASSGLPYVRNGQLRALAVSSAQRLGTLPEVPTVAESGFPGFEVLDWHGVFLPSGTPNEIKRKMADAVQYAVTHPEVVERLNGLGIAASTMAPADFPGFIDGQVARWSSLIEDRHISLE